MDKSIEIRLSEQELATVIAALRLYQYKQQTKPDERHEWLEVIATDAGMFNAIKDDEVDRLVERMNLAHPDSLEASADGALFARYDIHS